MDEWLGDYLGDDFLLPLNKHNISAAGSVQTWQIHDGWIVITENTSLSREMVFQPRRQAVVVYGTLLTAWGVLLNVLLGLLLARKPQADYVYPLKWLVLNSSFAQLLLAAFVIPLQAKIEHDGGWTLGPGLCRGWLLAQVFLVTLSIWSLFALTVDRILYVVHPLTYSRRMSRGKAAFMVAVTWVVSLLTLVPLAIPMKDPDYILEEVCAIGMDAQHALTLAISSFFAPALLTLVATLGLVMAVFAAKVQQTRLRMGRTSDGCHGQGEGEKPRGGGGCLCPDVTYATYAEYHDIGNVTCTVTAVNFCLLAMWAPFYITNMMLPFCREGVMCVDPTLWSLFLWLGYTSTGLSPVLWFIDRDVRRQCKALIRCEPRKALLPSNKTGSWYFMDTSANNSMLHHGQKKEEEVKTFRV